MHSPRRTGTEGGHEDLVMVLGLHLVREPVVSRQSWRWESFTFGFPDAGEWVGTGRESGECANEGGCRGHWLDGAIRILSWDPESAAALGS